MEHRVNFFFKKIELYVLKKNYINGLILILDTHLIPLQNEPSPILVGPKLGGPLSAGKVTFQESGCNIEK